MEDVAKEGSVIGEEPPPSKKSKDGVARKKRVSQACDRCRSRKDKCDGKRPSCTTCITNGRQCAYDTNVKKRGLPEGYVRGMEKLFGLAIQEVPGLEDSVITVITNDEEHNGFLGTWKDEGSSEALVESWRKSQISLELERLLSAPEIPTQNSKRKRTESESQMDRRMKPIGIVSAPSESLANYADIATPAWDDSKAAIQPDTQYQISPDANGSYETRQFVPDDYESILTPTSGCIGSVPLGILTAVPELPSEAWHLLDVYFSYTHSWLPIIEKHDLLRTSYQYSQKREQIPLAGPGSGNHAALWAAIAYAKYQHRAINNIPHAQGPVADMVWTAERMYAQARKLIPTEEGLYELGHVQALLILTLANLGVGHIRRAWILVGLAVRMAVDLQLNCGLKDVMATLQSKDRNRHVFLGCFILDTMVAARLGRRPHLRCDDLELLGPVEVDGLEEWDPWADCLSVRRNASNARGPASILSTFNGLLEVTKILNEGICIGESSNKLQLSTGLLEKLHIWSHSQASPIYFDTAATKTDQAMALLPHHHNLHIAYFNTLAMSQLLSYDHGKNDLNLEPSTRSAKQIVEILKQHSNNYGLLIVPPTFEYFTKTAYDVVREVNNSIENTHIMMNDWKHNLDNCLDSMGSAWPVFETFKSSPEFQPDRNTPEGRRYSQVAYDLISGARPSSETTSSYKAMSNFDGHGGFSPRAAQVMKSQRSQSSNIPRPTGIMASPISHRTSFGQSSSSSILQDFRQTSQPLLRASQVWPMQAPAINRPFIPDTPSTRQSGPVSDIDPTFQEFATLDATKW